VKKAIPALVLAILGYSPYSMIYAEETTHTDYSLNIGGWSSHNTGSKPNDFNQVNPTIGLRVWGKEKFLNGSPYFETDYIHGNSVNGKTLTVGGGIEWKLIKSTQINLCGGVQAFYMKYENARIRETWEGVLAVPYLCLEKNGYSLNFVRLGPDIIFAYISIPF
jgi:hypothetical protein